MMSEYKTGKTVAWNQTLMRIRDAQLFFERDTEPDGETQARILRERAQMMAQVPQKPKDEVESMPIVVFRLANETYGIESRYVEQVYPLRDYTPLPCTSAFVLGIMNVRGTIVSILDIRKIFGLPESGLTELNKTLILSDGKMTFGILADALVGVQTVRFSEIQSTLPMLTGIRETYLRGVTNDRLIVLDAAALLSDRQNVVHQTVQSRAVEKGK